MSSTKSPKGEDLHNLPLARSTHVQPWKSRGTNPSLALASYLPQVDLAALLGFLEAPIITIAFDEFAYDCWYPLKKHAKQFLRVKDFEYAIKSFNAVPEVFLTATGREEADYFDPTTFQRIRDVTQWWQHIAHFLRRVYTWATVEMKDLPIRPYLLDPRYRIPILIGAFATIINVRHGIDMKLPDRNEYWYKFGSLDSHQRWRARWPSNPMEYGGIETRLLTLVMSCEKEIDSAWFQPIIEAARAEFKMPPPDNNLEWVWMPDSGAFEPNIMPKKHVPTSVLRKHTYPKK
ncbi:uncharacterized protein F4822DRAFT_389570 [Hypoxylon trugodes]|uniref:uncharacterized protein n=1 Tax=Hypoxylon trugodes TaxID=326681 RepID=UPI00219D523E|nr:uncharacterized protein F4822DRAFT_389570 [Hypoxylon trugodes]KAI1392076.1 hypothetical protein F4822DRAFT_389570 [Hypoxylon trugodes]